MGFNNMRFNYTTDIGLGALILEVDIEFDASPYVPSTYLDPEEGGQVEDILGVRVHYASGVNYELARAEMGEWAGDLDVLALEYVLEHFDRYELLEHAGEL